MGPFDQAAIEERADVLVYSTPPLEEPVEVTGPITVTLYAASSARDTDFTAKLVDVHPDGKAILLNNGIIRASFRDSLEKPEPIEPGRIYPYQIAIWPTSNLLKTGHRIRLEISSSNFPHYEPFITIPRILRRSCCRSFPAPLRSHDRDEPRRPAA